MNMQLRLEKCCQLIGALMKCLDKSPDLCLNRAKLEGVLFVLFLICCNDTLFSFILLSSILLDPCF